MPGPGRTRPATQPDSEAEARRAGCGRGHSVTRGHSDFKFPLATRHSGSAAAPLRLRLATRHSPLATRPGLAGPPSLATCHSDSESPLHSPLADVRRHCHRPVTHHSDSPLATSHLRPLATHWHSPLATTCHAPLRLAGGALARHSEAAGVSPQPLATRHSPLASPLATPSRRSSLATRYSPLATPSRLSTHHSLPG